jgi:chitin disaccharide deacetylase
MARRLIVNADDFGLTPGVSRGILAAHRLGIVTSSTVLVTAGVDRESLAKARESGLGLGLHVNLTLGAPITPAKSLVGPDGRFMRDASRAAARAEAKDVETEVAAQIERFLALTHGPPTHLDSHHHVGVHSPVREVFLGAARRLGVPVRSEDDAARARARSAGLRTPDHFFGGSGPAPYWTREHTLGHLSRLPAGVSEFMTHPGFFDQALAFSRYGRQRETELVALGSPDARAVAAALGVTLCHFGDL